MYHIFKVTLKNVVEVTLALYVKKRILPLKRRSFKERDSIEFIRY